MSIPPEPVMAVERVGGERAREAEVLMLVAIAFHRLRFQDDPVGATASIDEVAVEWNAVLKPESVCDAVLSALWLFDSAWWWQPDEDDGEVDDIREEDEEWRIRRLAAQHVILSRFIQWDAP